MRKCLYLVIFMFSMCTACVSINTGAQGVEFMRGHMGYIPAAEQISPDGQKTASEYRVSVPLYKW